MILKDWLGPLLRGKFQSILWPGLFFIAKLHNHSLHKKALPEGRQSFVPGDPVSGGPVLASVALSTFTKTDPLAVDLDSTRWVAGAKTADVDRQERGQDSGGDTNWRLPCSSISLLPLSGRWQVWESGNRSQFSTYWVTTGQSTVQGLVGHGVNATWFIPHILSL